MPPHPHYDTPQRAKAQGAKEYCIAKGISYDEREISALFHIPERTGYRILTQNAPSRSTPISQGLVETRGRKTKLSEADVSEADHILKEEKCYDPAKPCSGIHRNREEGGPLRVLEALKVLEGFEQLEQLEQGDFLLLYRCRTHPPSGCVFNLRNIRYHYCNIYIGLLYIEILRLLPVPLDTPLIRSNHSS